MFILIFSMCLKGMLPIPAFSRTPSTIANRPEWRRPRWLRGGRVRCHSPLRSGSDERFGIKSKVRCTVLLYVFFCRTKRIIKIIRLSWYSIGAHLNVCHVATHKIKIKLLLPFVVFSRKILPSGQMGHSKSISHC